MASDLITREEMYRYVGAYVDTLITSSHKPMLHVQDEKTAANAGTFTQDAWQTRVLNTVVTNEITDASLASNQVTLPAGIYDAEWSAPAFAVDQHITRLQDVTNAVELERGSSEFSGALSAPPFIQTRSVGTARFTLSGTAAIELQHACDLTTASNGFGQQAVASILNVSGNDVYAILKIWKLD